MRRLNVQEKILYFQKLILFPNRAQDLRREIAQQQQQQHRVTSRAIV